MISFSLFEQQVDKFLNKKFNDYNQQDLTHDFMTFHLDELGIEYAGAIEFNKLIHIYNEFISFCKTKKWYNYSIYLYVPLDNSIIFPKCKNKLLTMVLHNYEPPSLYLFFNKEKFTLLGKTLEKESLTHSYIKITYFKQLIEEEFIEESIVLSHSTKLSSLTTLFQFPNSISPKLIR